jgi:hypothetical protein
MVRAPEIQSKLGKTLALEFNENYTIAKILKT